MKKNVFLFVFISLSNFLGYSQNTYSRVESLKYDDGVIAKNKWYDINDKIDSLKTYYNTGELNESFYYNKNNRFNGLCIQQNREGEILTSWSFDNGKLIERIDHKKIYNPRNKEQRLKNYTKIKVLNLNLKNKKSFNLFVSRAYARAYLGNTILAKKDFIIIKNYYEKLQKEDSKYFSPKRLASVYDLIASYYAQYEDEERAVHYKYLALKTNPTENRLTYNLGSYLISVQSYKLGLHYLNKVVERAPKHSFGNWGLTIVHTDLENYELALKHLNIAYLKEESINRLNSGTSERNLLTLKGYLQHKTGDSEQGIQNLNKSLAIDKDNSFAMRYLGEAYFDLQKYEKACYYLNQAKETGYQKKHDRNDLQYFIDQACHETENKFISIKNVPFLSQNPVVNSTKVENYPFKNFDFVITDYNSNLALAGTSDGTTIDVSTLKPGLYVLQLNDAVNQISIKLIKE